MAQLDNEENPFYTDASGFPCSIISIVEVCEHITWVPISGIDHYYTEGLRWSCLIPVTIFSFAILTIKKRFCEVLISGPRCTETKNPTVMYINRETLSILSILREM